MNTASSKSPRRYWHLLKYRTGAGETTQRHPGERTRAVDAVVEHVRRLVVTHLAETGR